MEFGACCPPKSSGCGSGTTFTWTNQQSVTWKSTSTLSGSIKIKESLVVEEVEETITLTESFEMGETKSVTESISFTTSCKQDQFSEETYVSQIWYVTVLEVPVKLYYTRCGVESTTDGTVKSHVLTGGFDCNFCTGCPSGQCSSQQLHGGCSQCTSSLALLL